MSSYQASSKSWRSKVPWGANGLGVWGDLEGRGQRLKEWGLATPQETVVLQ